MKLATREIVREIDRTTIKNYGISGLILMENAGRAVSNVILKEFPNIKTIAIICGGGNNAGDGFVVARHLLNAGKEVTTYLTKKVSDYKGDAKTNLNSLKRISKDVKRLKPNFSNYKKHGLIVDALFGTGLDREIKGSYKNVIESINSSKTPCISIDLPSGIDANTGFPLGTAIKAKVTVTFVVPKLGISIYPGLKHSEKIYIADISSPRFLEKKIPYELTTYKRCKKILKLRFNNTHKGTYGHTLILAGSSGKSGAATLCAHAAVRAGSGLVTVAIPKTIHKAIEEKTTEAMTEPIEDTDRGTFGAKSLVKILSILKNKTALAIGPGISTSDETKDFLLSLLKKSKVPIVADADAINIISENPNILKKIKFPVVLTPHPGEMARLSGTTSKEVQSDRINYAQQFAKKHRCYLILKGARSIVATPKGNICINPTGNPGMSSGGMGDVLTGVIASLISQKYSIEDSCILGTFIHGLAADLIAERKGQVGITATDVANTIPEAIKQISIQQKEPFFEIIR